MRPAPSWERILEPLARRFGAGIATEDGPPSPSQSRATRLRGSSEPGRSRVSRRHPQPPAGGQRGERDQRVAAPDLVTFTDEFIQVNERNQPFRLFDHQRELDLAA